MCFFVNYNSANGCLRTSRSWKKPLRRDSFRRDAKRDLKTLASSELKGSSDFIRNRRYLIDRPGPVLQHDFIRITPTFQLTLIKLGDVIRESAERRGWSAASTNAALTDAERRRTNPAGPSVNIYVRPPDPGLY